MTDRDPFALPPVSAKTTSHISALDSVLRMQAAKRTDARDILKALVRDLDGKVTYPSYRTAIRVAGIYTEAATSCALATATLLVKALEEKAARYLAAVPDGERLL